DREGLSPITLEFPSPIPYDRVDGDRIHLLVKLHPLPPVVRYWLPPLLWAALTFVGSSARQPITPPMQGLHVDKVGHMIQYGVLAFTLALTAVSYLDRVCISMTGPFIQKDLGIDDAHMGIIFGAFTFAYAAFEVPAGWLADRFGPRLMLTRVVLWWSAMTA